MNIDGIVGGSIWKFRSSNILNVGTIQVAPWHDLNRRDTGVVHSFTMVVPLHIGDPSPLDPSLVLPVPSKLPSDPTQALESLSAAIEAQLDPSIPSSSKLPMPVITAQIRLIHRNAQISVNAARSGTAEERARLDTVDVDLRTIEYERDRVRDEINRCAEYA